MKKEVLLEVVQGATNKEVAGQLVISEYTARNMVSNILGKLGLRSRSELVRWAFRSTGASFKAQSWTGGLNIWPIMLPALDGLAEPGLLANSISESPFGVILRYP